MNFQQDLDRLLLYLSVTGMTHPILTSDSFLVTLSNIVKHYYTRPMFMYISK